MLSCRAGKGLSVDADLVLLRSGAGCAGGGSRVDELVLGRTVSLSSKVRGRGTDSPTEMSVCLVFEEAREGADEMDDA